MYSVAKFYALQVGKLLCGWPHTFLEYALRRLDIDFVLFSAVMARHCLYMP